MKKITVKKLVVTTALVLVTVLITGLCSGAAYDSTTREGNQGCSACGLACAACVACSACTCLTCMPGNIEFSGADGFDTDDFNDGSGSFDFDFDIGNFGLEDMYGENDTDDDNSIAVYDSMEDYLEDAE